ncbi:peptidoglycan DD-metalloendopeptidase family protein [bacterium SCSIO 12643]|nr:peptidoglycan DD-metalloendopeptidase family protein [bacterium SCSIO 12643]
MRRLSSFLLVLFLWIGFGNIPDIQAQNKRAVLERKKSRLKSDIAYKNTLLKKNEKEQSNTLNQLILLQDKISKRLELIATINSEVKFLNSEIDKNEELIMSMERDIDKLKAEYARMIQFAYRNRSSYDKIMYVFASEDFNQAYKRLRYLQQYSEFRKKQTEDIKRLENILMKKNAELLAEKADKEALLLTENKEKSILAGEKEQQQQVYASLQSREEELKKEIREKQKERQQMQLAIERIIAEEVRLAQKKNTSKSGEWSLTPESKALANSFTANKGQLPWPVEKGTITDKYGVHAHPVLKSIKINNHGVGISTNPGATARAVFDGEVSRIIVIPGAGKAIIVRHGDYLTVYGNLKEVYVAAGDKVKVKQILGEIITIDGKTELQFEIHKGVNATTLDPALWLYKGR